MDEKLLFGGTAGEVKLTIDAEGLAGFAAYRDIASQASRFSAQRSAQVPPKNHEHDTPSDMERLG